MAVVINDVPGDSDANSYVDIDYGNTYFNSRINSSVWYNETEDDNKKRALITATKRIDYEKFKGTRTNSDQALAFPRSISDTFDGVSYSDVVPKPVKEATCELALHLLSVDISKTDTTNAPIQEVAMGSMKVKYKFDSNDNLTMPSTELPEFVLHLLSPLSDTVNRGNSFKISR